MTLRTIICVCTLGFVAIQTNTELRAETPRRSDRPNVLFITVDDLNTSLGCYGHPLVKSPNIDRLAKHGVRFDRAYCQYPLCNPSRTSFLTGRRPDTTRILDNFTPPRTHLDNVVFLPEYFRQHGYYTARMGKIAHTRYEDTVTWDIVKQPPDDGGLSGPTDKLDSEEIDGRTAKNIVQMLEEHPSQPLFIAAGFRRPHQPFQAPRRYFSMYPPESLPLPREPANDRVDIPPIALATAPDVPKNMTGESLRKNMASYFACITFVDAQIGIVLDAMERLGRLDNTIIVLFSDHGFHLGEHGGLWEKESLFEECARVPLIIAAPGKRRDVVSPRLAELVDVFPTLTELCGLPAPNGLEGTSLVPLLDDPNRPWKQAAFSMVTREGGIMGRSVRSERYRYTEWGNAKNAELYDHENDPHEYKNLVLHAKSREALKEHRKMLADGWTAAVPSQ